MQRRYRLTISGPAPASLLTEVRRRFGAVDVATAGESTEIRLRVADQAALRALLGVVWDASVEVLDLALEQSIAAPEDRSALRSARERGP